MTDLKQKAAWLLKRVRAAYSHTLQSTAAVDAVHQTMHAPEVQTARPKPAAPENLVPSHMEAESVAQVAVTWAKFGVTRESSRRCGPKDHAPEQSGCSRPCMACQASGDARELPGAE